MIYVHVLYRYVAHAQLKLILEPRDHDQLTISGRGEMVN